MQIEYERGISNPGNLYRMKKLMARAEAGETLNIGFLGGSITQGCLASAPELCYAYRVFQWWEKTFPQAKFHYINAGIGGTTSHFGTARAESDLLSHKPDFVIIEFSVNDESTEFFRETYEGLVRRVWQDENEPAVMLVHNVYYNNGGNAQIMHGQIARHYQLPAVSMQSSIYPEVVAGRIPNREITEDDLHPNDKGHELVASVITYALDKIRMAQTDDEEPEFPAPLTQNMRKQFGWIIVTMSLKITALSKIPEYRKKSKTVLRTAGRQKKRAHLLHLRYREVRLPCSLSAV